MDKLTPNEVLDSLGIFALPIILIAVPLGIGYSIGKKLKGQI